MEKCYNRFCAYFNIKSPEGDNCDSLFCDCLSSVKEPIYTLSEIKEKLTNGTLFSNNNKTLMLEEAKANPERLKEFDKVFIYSCKHGVYWGVDRGYAEHDYKAGVYDIQDAFGRTRHCDPSKGIKFIEANT